MDQEHQQIDPEEVKIYGMMQKSPILFVRMMWRLNPQPVRPEFKAQIDAIMLLTGEEWEKAKKNIEASWFEPFIKGVHFTWQQWLILFSIEKALKGEASRKISIASGHGIGKSSSMSWVILWYLYCYGEAQCPCTAPTADQMYDVLWKELKLWIEKMPEGVKDQYEWQTNYIRMKESPETWFARAKTASKENSEALAGVHANHVLTIADEASGVPEQIFNTAEGAWTSGDILVILISNPTRTTGYFYDTHHKLRNNWQTLRFSSIDSPIVDPEYEGQIAERHGRDSTEYGIRVLGVFPNEDAMDDSGYIPLFTESEIHEQPDLGPEMVFKGTSIMGIDPSGEGDDKTSWFIRDNFKMRKIHEERTSSAKSIAEKTITFIEKYSLDPRNVVVDAFGVGKDVGMEIALATKGKMRITTVNTGDQCENENDQELYLNQRAESFYKMKKWFQAGGELVANKNTKEELLTIRFKRNLKGKIQIMPKIDMKKKYGYKSPNDADAASLTFLKDVPRQTLEERKKAQDLLDQIGFDPYSVI